MTDDLRRYAPATVRNREPILRVLQRFLPTAGLVLEVASGSGEHTVYFAEHSHPGLVFQPSDPDPDARVSIDEWVRTTGLRNVRPALALNAAASDWPLDHADVVLCINMIHIAPWEAAIGLFVGAVRVLRSGGILFLYGPFRQNGRHISASNEAFDEDLRSRNPAWGVRDLEAVNDLATANGFAAPNVIPMPANNLSLVFARQSAPES